MYEYKAKLREIIDGDTIDVEIDLGFGTYKNARLRLKGIDTPETRTSRKKEKKAGKLVELFVEKLLDRSGAMTIRTYKDGKGSFGRYIADIYIDELDISLNDYLLNNKFARVYRSGAPEWRGKTLNNIIKELTFLETNKLKGE